MTSIPIVHYHAFVIVKLRVLLVPMMLVMFLVLFVIMVVPVLRMHRRDIEHRNKCRNANTYAPSYFHRTSSQTRRRYSGRSDSLSASVRVQGFVLADSGPRIEEANPRRLSHLTWATQILSNPR